MEEKKIFFQEQVFYLAGQNTQPILQIWIQHLNLNQQIQATECMYVF